MISMYYPAQPNPSKILLDQQPEAKDWDSTTAYMPPLTAALYDKLFVPFGFPNNTFEQLSTFCQQNAPTQNESMTYPLLIFSPGGGTARFWYTTVLEDVARKGYIVVAIDHAYDALVVEYPDGRAVIGLNKTFTRDEVELLVRVRAQDMSFVIDELSAQFSDLPLIVEALDLRKKLGRGGEKQLGKLDGMRVLEVMVEYVSAFAEFVLMGRNGSLLGSNGNERFPEVKVKRHI